MDLTLPKVAFGMVLAIAQLAFLPGNAAAQMVLLTPQSIAGLGTYSNNANLLIDGYIPPRGTQSDASTNVFWSNTAATFKSTTGRL